MSKALLVVDNSPSEGFGHLSRTLNLLYYTFPKGYKFDLISENPPGISVATVFSFRVLKEMPQKIDGYSFIIIDTYSHEIISKFKKLGNSVSIIQIIDESVPTECIIEEAFIVDLERSKPRMFRENYTFGLLTFNPELEKIKNSLSSRRSTENTKRSRILVNLGGSTQIKNILFRLLRLIADIKHIEFYVFCHESIKREVTQRFNSSNNIKFKEYSYLERSTYLDTLCNSDILVCTAGTSFIEALYMGMRVIVFDYPESAHHNWVNLQNNKLVVGAFSVDEIESIEFVTCLKTKKHQTIHKKDKVEIIPADLSLLRKKVTK